MPATNEDAALSYQSGDFCLLIWDSYNTNSADALKSLAEILKVKEEKTGQVSLNINALEMEGWEARDYTTEVLKSAADLYSFDDPTPRAALHCIQACVDYLACVCHQSTSDMNENLKIISRSFVTHGYKEIEVEE